MLDNARDEADGIFVENSAKPSITHYFPEEERTQSERKHAPRQQESRNLRCKAAMTAEENAEQTRAKRTGSNTPRQSDFLVGT